MKKTAHQNSKVVQLLKPQSVAAGAAASTSSVDTKGYRECLFILSTGTATGSIASALIRESSDDGVTDAFANVLDNDGNTLAFAAVDSTTDDTVYIGRVDCVRSERYLEVRYDVDTDVVLFAVLAVLSDPIEPPVDDEQVQTVAFTHDAD